MTVNVPLVFGGASIQFPWSTAGTGFYMKMIPDLMANYPGIPDYRTLRTDEVRFFYEAIRKSLEKMSAPAAPSASARK